MRFILTLVILLAGGCVGVGDAAAAPAGKRVALLSMANTNPWVSAWTSTFIKSADKLGMKVTNLTSPYDPAMQSQEIDDAIAQKFDVILIEYANDQAVIPALTRAKAAGVPVILWATPLQKQFEDLFLSYVGSDQVELGRLAGESLVKGLAKEGKTKGQIVAITGLAQQLMTQMRMEGFREVLAKSPDIKLVAVEDGKWNTALSERIASDLFLRFGGTGGVDGVFAMADNQATGVIQAARAAGVTLGVARKGVVVVASNCMKDGIVHIKDGQQYGTGTQLPTLEAETAVKLVAKYFDGGTLQKYEYIKAHQITGDNAEEFAVACSY